MRQIVLDTETTGLDPAQGHRIIEIGCVELINRRITGNTYHVYLQPEREIEADAKNVHGITNEFLKDKPKFIAVVHEFLAYIKDAEIIIHNASFDVGFINAELVRCGGVIGKFNDYCKVIDTLKMARQLHMGQRNSLDALCKRYHVDNSHREWHGALLDAELLAKIYLAMTGGQSSLFADLESTQTHNAAAIESAVLEARVFSTPIIYADAQECARHVEKLKEIQSDLW